VKFKKKDKKDLYNSLEPQFLKLQDVSQ